MNVNKVTHLEPEEKDFFKQFHKRGCSNYTHPGINHLCLDFSDSRLHNSKLIDIFKERYEKGHNLISQAVREKRRYDLVDLTSQETIEVEVTGKIKPDADISYFFTKEGWKREKSKRI